MPKKRDHNPYRIKLADGSTIERDYRTDDAGNQVPYGNWKWVVYDPSRRPRTKKVNLRTKDKGGALRKANEYLTLRATGALDPWTDHAPRDGVTITKAAEQYAQEKERSGKSPDTVKTDKGHLKRLELTLHPGFLVQHVERRHVEAFLSKPTRAKTPPSGAYRQRVRATLHHFFEWAVERGMIRTNPAADIAPPKAAHARREHITDAEREAIIEAIEASERSTGKDRTWLKDWITFGFGTGLRPGEQRQLKWSAVSLAERSVRVGKGHRTKTSKSARTVPVRGDALAVLQRRVKARKGTKDDYVFTGKGGDPVEPRYVTKQIQSFAEAAEIEKNVVAYSLRHGYGTRMAQAGVPLWELANLMGTSMKMIERHYGHYDPNRGAAHVDRVFGTNGSDPAPNGSGDNQEKGLQDGATRRKNTKAK